MAIPLALPLAPVLFPGATAAAATFVVGSSVYLANSIYGFRRPMSLPRVTGLEGVATLTEKVADYLAAARVPVGFPVPPPLQDPFGSAAAFGMWALSSAKQAFSELSWGLVNSRPKQQPSVSALVQMGVGIYQFKYVHTRTTTPQINSAGSVVVPADYYESVSGWLNAGNVWGVEVLGGSAVAEYKTIPGPSTLQRGAGATYRVKREDGTWTQEFSLVSGWWDGTTYSSNANFVVTETLAVVAVTKDGADVTPYDPLPAINRQEIKVGALPAYPGIEVYPAPLPLPSPAPDGEPLPEVEPITEPAAPPALPPAIPAAPPLTAPAFPEAPRQINNSGVLIPLAPAPAAITPTDAHYPVPGGAPVGSIAKAPAATLAAIAVEVGRVEQKLERLLNPLASDNAGDLMRLVWDAAQQIINAQLDNRDGGEYVLSSPCELDANGDRIESTVTYPETEDNFSAVLVRLDALAALLQTHKELKQPICKGTPATGQPVTVQFVQIE